MAPKDFVKPVDLLLRVIRQHHPMGVGEAEVVASCFKVVNVKRKTVLLLPGQTAHQLYFIVSGVLHMYYADERGLQYSCNFFMPGELATDLESFAKQLPAGNALEALKSTTCLSISCKASGVLMQQSPAFHKYAMDVIEATAMDNINRTKDLLGLPPEARYQKLLATRPDLIREIPQKYIARFLGISPESLSRIRNRLVTQHVPE